MKKIIIAILVFPSIIYGQCDSLEITYQIDYLKKESKRREIFFSNVHKDSIQINFNEGFNEDSISIIIDGVKKSIILNTNSSLGFAGSINFRKPTPNSKIQIEYKGAIALINYNTKYNMIHIWSEDCFFLVRHTNRMIIYQ